MRFQSIESVRAIERDATSKHGPHHLMARAGEVAADQLMRRTGATARVVVVCGPGNNGGDGWVMAHHLRRTGHEVSVWQLYDTQPISPEALHARAAWIGEGGVTHHGPPALPNDDKPTWLVDAIFGVGLKRPLDNVARSAIEWMHASGARLCALDVPSGLNADTGSWVGGVAGPAVELTVSFIADKAGLHTGAGIQAAGRVVVEPLGTEYAEGTIGCVGPSDFRTICQSRQLAAHKGSFGVLKVVGGQPGMVGAAVLCARAASRLGAGKVFVSLLSDPLPGGLDLLHPELMFRDPPEGLTVNAQVIGCGAGKGERAIQAVRMALSSTSAMVLDADALNILAADPILFSTLAERSAPTVMTPHPLEAARLLGATAAQIQNDRMGAASQLARQSGAIVVLKGAGTVIAEGERRWINTTGGPCLATAGTGDVLAGMLGGLLGQGFAPLEATQAAVWLHGRAAHRFGRDIGLCAGEVAALAAAELSELRSATSLTGR